MNYEINKTINGNDVPIINISERIKTCTVHNMLMQEMQSKPKEPVKPDVPDAMLQVQLNYANEDSFGTKDSWESYDTLYKRQSADYIEFITNNILNYMMAFPQCFGGIISRLGENRHLIPQMSATEFEEVIKAINLIFTPQIGVWPALKYSLSETLDGGSQRFNPEIKLDSTSEKPRDEQIADGYMNMDPNSVNESYLHLNSLMNRLSCATLFGNTYGYTVASDVIAAADHFPMEDLGFETRIHNRRLINREHAFVVFNHYDPKLIIGASSRFFNYVEPRYKDLLIQKPSRVPGYELGIQDISFELTDHANKTHKVRLNREYEDRNWDGAYIIPMTWYNLAKCIIELQFGNAHTKENLPLFIHNLPYYNGRVYTSGIRRDELDIHEDAVKQQKEMIANLSDKNFFTVKTAEESK